MWGGTRRRRGGCGRKRQGERVEFRWEGICLGVLKEGEGPWPGGVLVFVQGFGLVREGRMTKGRGDRQSSLTSDIQCV